MRQTKGVQKVPGLGHATVGKECPGLNAVETAMASKPGLQGRIWFGQGLLYDEVHQLLQDIAILDRPEQKNLSDGPGSGQSPGKLV